MTNNLNFTKYNIHRKSWKILCKCKLSNSKYWSFSHLKVLTSEWGSTVYNLNCCPRNVPFQDILTPYYDFALIWLFVLAGCARLRYTHGGCQCRCCVYLIFRAGLSAHFVQGVWASAFGRWYQWDPWKCGIFTLNTKAAAHIKHTIFNWFENSW